MLLTPAQIKWKSFESRRNSFFFTRGGCVSCLCACLDARLLPQSYQYPNLSEGADRVGGQLRGDKECPFSGVTKSGRIWRKVPENCARSVDKGLTLLLLSSRAVWKSRWPSWAPVPNKPTVSVDVKQHFNNCPVFPSLISLTVSVDVKHHVYLLTCFRAQELCERRGGRSGLSSPINLQFLWT